MVHADLVLVGIQIAVFELFVDRFSKVKSHAFRHLRENAGLLRFASRMSILLNIITLARDYFGVSCPVYLGGAFMAPSIVGGATLIVAFNILCDMAYVAKVSPGPLYAQYAFLARLPDPDRTHKRSYKIMATFILIHLAIVIAALAVRFAKGGREAVMDECVMGLELWLLAGLFIFYMALLSLCLFMFGLKVAPEHQLSVNYIRLITVGDMLTLIMFLVINMVPGTYTSWKANFFDPSLWGIIFNFIQPIITIFWTQVYEFLFVQHNVCGCLSPRGRRIKLQQDFEATAFKRLITDLQITPQISQDIIRTYRNPKPLNAVEVTWRAVSYMFFLMAPTFEDFEICRDSLTLILKLLTDVTPGTTCTISSTEYNTLLKLGETYHLDSPKAIVNHVSMSPIELQNVAVDLAFLLSLFTDVQPDDETADEL